VQEVQQKKIEKKKRKKKKKKKKNNRNTISMDLERVLYCMPQVNAQKPNNIKQGSTVIFGQTWGLSSIAPIATY